MKRHTLAALVSLAAFAVAAQADVGTALLKPSTATRPKDDTTGSQMGSYNGIKRAIGIVDFEVDNGCSFDDGAKTNMRAMLESALFATNRFVIVERGNLDAVMNEQDLQSSKRAAKGSGVAQTGKIRSARYLATALVTEVSSNTSGDSGGVRIKGFSVGGSATKSSIVLVVKLVDSTTSEVVASERIRGVAGKSGLNLGYDGHGWGGELGTFAKTPIGEAAQDCINQAVKFIAAKMEAFPVEGNVVLASEQAIVINLGENYGIHSGQSFVIRRKGETLVDPDTGEILGTSDGETLGVIEVVSTKEKTSSCKLVSGDMPQRGDAVVLK
ncbi:MAG TPA: CsgG/HfaB family protein [Opitutaceae bacterium]|nr:CsgG/HfaB family protein [Opitutaceae bacterium]